MAATTSGTKTVTHTVAPHLPATMLTTLLATPIETLTVKRIGETLMTDYIWPLQCVGVLLTAALIGALILVMEEKRE